jgi:Putative zinc-finger
VTFSLGGPGPGCSATRMRRLAAGEIEGAERARLLEHVAGCARCQETQGELAEEDRALAAALPFEDFAAGVAERLARTERPASRAPSLRRWMPLALAATLVASVAVPLVARLSAPPREDGVRVKGVAGMSLYVQERGGARLLAPGEAIPPGARLRLSLSPGGRKHAAVLLLDADGAAVLYAGKAVAGPLPDAFEWTGSSEGTLVAALADEPLDAGALAARATKGGAEAVRSRGVEVVARALRRSRP